MADDSKKYGLAGISIVEGDEKNPEGSIGFHVTNTIGTIGVWMKVPGAVSYRYAQLPKAMTKLEASEHLLTLKEFSGHKQVKAFLESQITKLTPVPKSAKETKAPVTPKKPPAPSKTERDHEKGEKRGGGEGTLAKLKQVAETAKAKKA